MGTTCARRVEVVAHGGFERRASLLQHLSHRLARRSVAGGRRRLFELGHELVNALQTVVAVVRSVIERAITQS